MALVDVSDVLVLAILLPVPRLPAIVKGILVRLLIRRSGCGSIHLLHLRPFKALARVFGNRGHVPRPAGWGVVLWHTGRLGILGRRSLGDSGPPVRVSGSFLFSSPSLLCSTSSSEPFPQFHPGVLALAAAVVDLQEKEAIKQAPSSSGYYSRLFVTPKVTGRWRPVIDL